MEFGGLAGGLERRLHLLDLVRWNAGVGFAVEAEHRLLHLAAQDRWNSSARRHS